MSRRTQLLPLPPSALLHAAASQQVPSLSNPELQVDPDIAMQLAIQAASFQTQREQQEARPENTTAQYSPKVKEWNEWCDAKECSDGRLVTGGKLHLWLREVVLPRGNKRKKDAAGNALPLKAEGVEGYVKPIIDLWTQQKQKNVLPSNAEHPRNSDVIQLIKSVGRNLERTRKVTYQDKGEGTILDTYSKAEKQKVVEFWWSVKTHHGEHLRNAAGFLIQNSTMIRGNNVRLLQISDMWSRESEGEGASTCVVLGITSRQGKTNQMGRADFTGAMRHKNVFVCPQGATAIYLFWRYHIENETPPDTTDRRKWYDVYFMKVSQAQQQRRKKRRNARKNVAVEQLSESGSTPTATPEQREEQLPEGEMDNGNAVDDEDNDPGAMSYDAQYRSYVKAFKAAGIRATKVTHLPRGVAARKATHEGVQAEQVNQMGGWGRNAKTLSYTYDLPPETMRSLGDWPIEGKGFFLPRAAETPSMELQRKIFPWIEEQREEGVDCIAGSHFLDLLKHLRLVFLQDSVFWKKAYPSHPIFRNELFESPTYKEFAERLEAAAQVAENPANATIHQLAPVIANAIEMGIASITTGLAAQQMATEQLRRDIIAQTSQQTSRVIAAFLASQQAAANVFTDHIQSTEQLPEPSGIIVPVTSVLPPTPTVAIHSASYTLRRDLTSVAEVWQEYESGFPPGPAVRELEERHQGKWRSQDASNNRFFSRQKIFYKEIQKRITAEKRTGSSIAASMDEERKEKDMTVAKYREYLGKSG